MNDRKNINRFDPTDRQDRQTDREIEIKYNKINQLCDSYVVNLFVDYVKLT